MALTSPQRRFLIIWILFHSFALFVNLTDVRGSIGDYTIEIPSSPDSTVNKPSKADSIKIAKKDSIVGLIVTRKLNGMDASYLDSIYKADYSQVKDVSGTDVSFHPHRYIETVTFLFTNGRINSDFWPFTPYSEKGTLVEDQDTRTDYYGGIFNSYGFPEYIFYILLGLGIVFIPKLWNSAPSA